MPRSESRRKRVWSNEETAKLLAHLDVDIQLQGRDYLRYCDLSDQGIERGISDAIRRLQIATKRQYTQDQIRERLLSLLKEKRNKPGGRLADLMRFGTEDLDNLDQHLTDLVKSNFETIFQSVPTRRRRRVITVDTHDAGSRNASAQPTDPPPTRQTQGRSITPHHNRSLRSTPYNTPQSHERGRLKPCRRSPTVVVQQRDLSASQTAISVESTLSPAPPSDGSRSPKPCNEQGEDLSSRAVENVDSPMSSHTEQSASDDSSNQYLGDLLQDNVCLRKKLGDTEARCRRLEEQYLEREGFLRKTSGLDSEMQKALESKCNKIADLNAQMRRQEFLEPFLNIKSGIVCATECPKIAHKHEELKWACGFISTMHGLHHLPPQTKVEPISDLMPLLDSIFGNFTESYLTETKQWEGNISANELVRSLTGAAISKWVFQQELRLPDIASTPLLEAYRSYISSVCDQNVLRGLDFAAHLTVMEDEHFREVVLNRHATRLAIRLSAALYPLIQSKTRLRVTRDLRKILVQPFRLALDIKCLIMVGKDLYECIWPTRGSPFKERRMIDEPADYAQAGNDKTLDPNPLVRLPILPGLRIYAYERQMVDYNGFRNGCEEVLKGSVVAKARVLIM